MNRKPGSQTGEATRRRIVDAALETLKNEGFAGATSRAIARAGGFNQALIFYHFGTLDGLLLAALDKTSEERLSRYRAAVRKAESAEELAEVAAHVYKEDRDRGHMTVVSQMVAGSVARPGLANEVLSRMEPWIELCEEALAKALSPVPAAQALPLRNLAYAVVTFYLGLNLLTHLDEDRERTEALVEQLRRLAPLLSTASAESTFRRTS
jgi:AcrR family transcriptional regulator